MSPADNGVSALSAEEISARALAAVNAAKSVHVVSDDGKGLKYDVRGDGG